MSLNKRGINKFKNNCLDITLVVYSLPKLL